MTSRSSTPPGRSAHATPARPSLLRQVNARELLRLLRTHAPCTKADLARLSGLSVPAVTASVAQLEELGIVRSLGPSHSNAGRPPGMLCFVPTCGFVAAVDIGGTRLRLRLTDLAGTEVAAWSTLLGRGDKTPETLCKRVDEGLRECCSSGRVSRRKVLHLTAGAPGITDSRAGVVLSAPNLSHWNNIPLRDLLKRQTGIPVTVENDTNLAALGEHRCGAAEGVDNFVFLSLGTGLGAGIVVGGALHPGAHWSAGEVGYLSIRAAARETPRLRNTGQLERLAGGAGLEQRWRENLLRHGVSTPALAKLRASKILDRAQAGDTVAHEVLQATATLLADAITDIALVLDPELVVLGGGIGSHPAVCHAVELSLQGNEFARPVLRSSALGAAAQLAGAVAVSLSAAESVLLS